MLDFLIEHLLQNGIEEMSEEEVREYAKFKNSDYNLGDVVFISEPQNIKNKKRLEKYCCDTNISSND